MICTLKVGLNHQLIKVQIFVTKYNDSFKQQVIEFDLQHGKNHPGDETEIPKNVSAIQNRRITFTLSDFRAGSVEHYSKKVAGTQERNFCATQPNEI